MSEQVIDFSDVAEAGGSAGRPDEPSTAKSTPGPQGGGDSVNTSGDRGKPEGSGAACLWRECGQSFPHASALLEHIDQGASVFLPHPEPRLYGTPGSQTGFPHPCRLAYRRHDYMNA